MAEPTHAQRIERSTAAKCRITDLLHGRYVTRDSARPSYVETPFGDVSRVNLIGAIVAKTGNKTILLDDGSGQIEARAFDDERLFAHAAPGTIALVIGRPRSYNDQPYVVAEICKTLAGTKWLELRQAELSRTPKSETRAEIAPIASKEEKKRDKKEMKTEEKTEKAVAHKDEVISLTADKVLEIIRTLDDGGGAPVEKVIAKAGRADAETLVTNLLAEGEIFEIRPGRVKVLE